MRPCSNRQDRSGERFDQTHWSIVLAAGREADAPKSAQIALAELCRTYSVPLYGFIRGRGYALHDAQDRTQGFFCHLIEHQIYTRVDQTKGRFRSFLLEAVKHFLNDAYERERALKRGVGREFLPLQEEQALAAAALFRSSAAPGTDIGDDRFFERPWAETLVATTLARQAAEFEAERKGPLHKALEVFVQDSAEPLPSCNQFAARLAMPAVTVRSHVNRLRARDREPREEVGEEPRELLRVLKAH